MKKVTSIQLLGMLAYLLGTLEIIFSFSSMQDPRYLLLAVAVVFYIAGVIMLVYPIEKRNRYIYFISVIIAPASFFACFLLLDIGQNYGIRIPFIGELILSIVVSFIGSLMLIKVFSKGEQVHARD